MSKNIYRVNKKSDVDIIFKNNLLKPIFLVFVDNKTDEKLVNEIEKTLLILSKKNTYGISLIINFDKFTDEMNFFNQYNENLPSFVSFFLGQQVTEHSSNSNSNSNSNNNFISVIVSIIEKIHLNYVSKLNVMFTEPMQIPDPEPNHDPNPGPNPNANPDPNYNANYNPNPNPSANTNPNPGPNTNTASILDATNNMAIANNTAPSYVTHIDHNPEQKLMQVDGIEGSDNDTDEIRLKKEKLKLLLKQKELLEIHKSN